MNLLPMQNETIVSSLKAREVIQQIQNVTAPPTRDKKELDTNTQFIGFIDQMTFRLSMKLKVPENFSPIIYGRVDETSLGSIVYIRFRLFFSSQLFLVFWSSICLLAFLLFFFLFKEPLYASLALLVGILNYSISVINFKRKSRESLTALLYVLKMD